MSRLDTAIMIASKAHFGQQDKAGKAYILHPLRLALKMQTDDEQIVAVLHDVLEDSDVTVDNLRQQGFSQTIIDALVCMTKKKNEEYMDYIARIKSNTIASAVKACDLRDNLDVTRLDFLNDVDLQRIKKYRKALTLLEKSV